MILSLMSFENRISTAFEATFSHFSIMAFLWVSMISRFSFLSIGLKTKTRKSRQILIFGSIKLKWMWTCFLNTILNFSGLKLNPPRPPAPPPKKKQKQTQVNKFKAVRISWKTKMWHIISKLAELFWERCHLNNISRVQYFSILGFLMNFCDFWVFDFGYRAQNENLEITENLYFFSFFFPSYIKWVLCIYFFIL